MASRSWNRVELIGNLTRDPELRFTPNGAAVCTFGIATNRTYVTEGERKEEVDFHRLVAWNKLAELCNQLLKKGHRVFISGRLQTRSWEAQDGQTRQVTEIVIEDMILLTPKAFNGDSVAATEDVYAEAKPAPKVEDVKEAVAEVKEKPKAAEQSSRTASTEGRTASTEGRTASTKTASAEAPQENVPDDEDLPF